MYFFAQDGRTTVVKAGKQFEKLAENRIEGPLVATPAILDGTVFLRTSTSLYRIGKKPETTAHGVSNGELKVDARSSTFAVCATRPVPENRPGCALPLARSSDGK